MEGFSLENVLPRYLHVMCHVCHVSCGLIILGVLVDPRLFPEALTVKY